jgi:GT2 family glycosyltransferase
MPNIHLIIIAYAMTESLASLFDTLSGPDVTWHLFLHSQRPNVVALCERLARKPGVEYYDYGTNRGVARSYNDGFINAYQAGADVAAIVCDDMYIGRSGLDALVDGAMRHPEAGRVQVQGFNQPTQSIVDVGFAFSVIQRATFEQIGYFDQNFFPAYFEDIDYGRRMELSGLPTYNVGPIDLNHIGSASHRADPAITEQHHRTFMLNSEYYRRKWGGDIGAECFGVPFNKPQFTLRIAEEDRHAPYPAYNREDWGVVVL